MKNKRHYQLVALTVVLGVIISSAFLMATHEKSANTSDWVHYYDFSDSSWAEPGFDKTQARFKNGIGQPIIIEMISLNDTLPDGRPHRGTTAVLTSRDVYFPSGHQNITIYLSNGTMHNLPDVYFNESFSQIEINEDDIIQYWHQLKECRDENNVIWWETAWETRLVLMESD